MTERVASVVAELRRGLEELYGERLERVVLFGSQARGDATAESDVDVLAVLHGAVRPGDEVRRTSRLVGSLSLEHGVDLGLVFISSGRFRSERSPFVLNVHREGVAV